MYMSLYAMEVTTEVDPVTGDAAEYIDMDVTCSSSSPGFISFSATSPPQNREFEFQMCSSAVNSGQHITSPADELFYKGQLLPLHLPPRLQMVQKLLETSSSCSSGGAVHPRAASVPPSAVVSPSESRRLSSSEIPINTDEHNLFEISTEMKSLIEKENQRRHWSRKIKESLITQKLKASRAFIKNLFTKPGCSDAEIDPKSKFEGSRSSKSPTNKNTFGKIENLGEYSINNGSNKNNINIPHRRSFSGVIQKHCPTKYPPSCSSRSSASSLSSSFSFGSNGSLDLQSLMRSSNASLETDNSIEGAIAHCKQSFSPRKLIMSESDQQRFELSRI